MQLYLIFEVLYYTLKRLGNTEKVVSWKSKGLPTENFIPSTTTDNSLSPTITWHANSNFCLVFKGRCLKQKSATHTNPNRINLFIIYELDTNVTRFKF